MNYLAHLVLSGTDPEIRMGNLMGDFCTGRLDHPRYHALPKGIRLGLALHRWIDHQTDHEVTWNPMIDFFREQYGKWAPAVLDIVGDYVVVQAWENWGLDAFHVVEEKIYADLTSQYHHAPDKMKPMLDSLLTHRWLSGYGTLEGMERAIGNVSRRIKKPLPWDPVYHLLSQDSDRLFSVHIPFFQKMMVQAEDFRKSHIES